MRKLFFLVFILFLTVKIFSQWVQTNGPTSSRSITCLAVSGINLFAGTRYLSGGNGTTSGGVYLSTDNGGTWTNAGLGVKTVNALAFRGSNLFAGLTGSIDGGGGVSLSTNNGGNWARTGLELTSVIALVVTGTNVLAGTYYLGGAGSDAGVYLFLDSGVWVFVSSGMTTN